MKDQFRLSFTIKLLLNVMIINKHKFVCTVGIKGQSHILCDLIHIDTKNVEMYVPLPLLLHVYRYRLICYYTPLLCRYVVAKL